MEYFIGVDLHKTQMTVHVRSEDNDNVGFSTYPTTKIGFQTFKCVIENWKEKGNGVQIAVESTGNTKYFRDQMEEVGAVVKVVNTSKFKIVAQSTKKTDKNDAAILSEFLQKDMLPESYLSSTKSANIKLILGIRTSIVKENVELKNKVHAILLALGIISKKGLLQSKKGRLEVQNVLESLGDHELEAQSVNLILNRIVENEKYVKDLEKQLEKATAEDNMVQRLLTIPGCGKISAWTIRAYTDEISRFESGKKYASYCGLVPWVQNSNETIHHGHITKRGPKELRTAFVNIVMGIRRTKVSKDWAIMKRYEHIKAQRGAGRSVVAMARKLAEITWTILSREEDFDVSKMSQVYEPRIVQLAREAI